MAEGDYEPAGSARLELVAGVALLHEEDAVVEAMLQGWARQQLGGRGLSAQTVAHRRAVVRRFLAYTNEYPWRWTAAHLDEWSADLVAAKTHRKSTMRSYHNAIGCFEQYLLAPQYRGSRSARPGSARTRPGSVSRRTPGRTWWTTRAARTGGR